MSASRGLDMIAAASGMILAAPVLLLAAAGIKMTSPGPVFYRARRMGRGGRPFVMLKLRTMETGPSPGTLVTVPGDSRVFAFGAFLRTTKIDELPQLWNILKGDMALVGPRPEDPAIVEGHYTPAEHQTLRVRPGLTSPGTLWYYACGEALIDPDDPMESYFEVMHEKLRKDADYVRNASLRTDLKLILSTFALIVRKSTAAAPPAEPCTGARSAAR